MMTKTTAQETLHRYKALIDSKVEGLLTGLSLRGTLTEACGHALRGGKRFRPAIVFMVAEALGKGADVSQAALAVELFHTASLVADDMPCMDDDGERRGGVATHVKYGEAVALLVSYALIAEGYRLLALRAPCCPEASLLAIENVAENTGVDGATGGQQLDLFPPDGSLETVREVLKLKTVSLFEISLVLGWLHGGGDLAALQQVKQLAYHYGMAFQIADDLDDLEQDVANDCQVNLALVFGKEKALEQFLQEATAYRKLLVELGIDSTALLSLVETLEQKVSCF